MSQENVENLRLAFDAFKRRDTGAWLALCDPENTEPWREGAP